MLQTGHLPPRHRSALRASTALVGIGLLVAAPVLWSAAPVLGIRPAMANGGASGGNAGGVDSNTGAGGIGVAGSGGGAGLTGGAGGTGMAPGGLGGTIGGGSGGDGTADPLQGSGGGGGAVGSVSATLPGGPLTGGNGGNGGATDSIVGTGGGGGAGAAGLVVTGTGSLGTLNGTVTGGNGGAGGSGGSAVVGANSHGGDGGTGGAGVIFTQSATVTIGGNVTGGSGGNGGSGYRDLDASQGGTAGAAGAGIVGGDLDLTLNATVSGGGSGGSMGYALDFTGGSNTLRLGEGGGLSGGIRIQAGDLTVPVTVSDQTLGNVISGAGSVTKNGAGTLILTGANTYSGTTQIDAGRLQIGNGGTSGTLGTGAVTNNAQLSFNRSDGVTVNNTIGGTGSVIQEGTGTLILTGDNTYSGGTTIDAGTTLQVGSNGTAGSIGTGTATVSGTLAYNRSNEAVVGNVIAGTGQLRQSGSGTLVLTGANTYTGGTTIDAGTILQVGQAGTVGNLGTGLVSNSGTLVFNRSDGITHGGVIGGTGVVEQAGAGTLVLTGANTYTGGTRILASTTLQIGDGGLSGTAGTGNIVNNGTLLLNRSNSFVLENSIFGSGVVRQTGSGTSVLTGTNIHSGGTTISAGTLQIGNGGTSGSLLGDVINNSRLAFNRIDTVNFNGVISGTGSVRQMGPGLLILSRDNTYTGGTIINAGATLQIGDRGTSGSITGNVSNDGTLDFARSDSVSYGGMVSGAGRVRILSGGVTLTGANTYAGGTGIAAGATLTLGKGGSIQGAVANDGLLRFASGATSFAGAITGQGALDVHSGAVMLTGANTYAGGTSIAANTTLQIGNGGTSGWLGTGDLTNAGTIIFSRSDAVTYGGAISGAGALVQSGSGNLNLTGNSSYTGATTVNAGLLSVNGSIASSMGLNVNAGGAVSGTGILPGTSIAAGGTIAPGNSVGTLSVQGNLKLMMGATMVAEVLGAKADRINVSGTAALGGATLRLVPTGGTYSFNTPYTLISAGSVSGQFATVGTQGSFGAGVTSEIGYAANAVNLTLNPASLLPGTIGAGLAPGLVGFLPSNLRNTGSALDAARAAGGNMQPFFGVYAAPVQQIGNAVNQLSGEVGTSTTVGMGLIAGQQFLSSMLNPFSFGREALMGTRIAANGSADGDDAAPGVPRSRYSMWGQASGGYSRVAGEGGAGSATRSARGAGFAAGLDIAVGAQSTVGIAAGAGETSASLSGGLGRASSWTGQLGVFGRTRLDTRAGGFTLEGAAAISFLETDTRRTQYFLNNAEQRASHDARVYSFRLEGRHDGLRRAGISFQPLLALQAQVVDSAGYTERSSAPGTPTGVTVAGSTNSTVRTELGVQAEGRVPVGTRMVRGFGRVAWAHYLMREQSSVTALQAFPGQGFVVQGARPDADSAILAAGLETEIAPRWTLGARVDSELSSRVREISGTVRLRYSF